MNQRSLYLIPGCSDFYFGQYVRYIFQSVSIILFFCSVNLAGQVKLDSLASSFKLNDVTGKPFELKEHLSNQLTVILFWATWGHDSSEMLDSVEQIYRDYHAKGLEAVGVCVEQQNISDTLRNKIIASISGKQITFPIIFDEQLKTFRSYNVIAVPSTYILNSQGMLVQLLEGFPIVGREKLFEFIREHFDGKRIANLHKKYEREPNKRALRLFNMAKMQFSKEQLDTAKKYALEAFADDSQFIQASLLLTEIEIANDSLKNAETCITRALEIEPKSEDALILSGLLSAKKGEKEKAVKILEAVINNNDSLALAHCYLGYAFGLGGNYERSFTEFLKAENLSPNEYRIPQLRAEIDSHAGKQNEVIADKLKAKRLRKQKL